MKRDHMIGSLITVVGTAALLGGSYVLAASDANGTKAAYAGGEVQGELPAAIRAQVTGRIVEWEREDGGYEVETRSDDDREREFHFDDQGRLSGYEEEDDD